MPFIAITIIKLKTAYVNANAKIEQFFAILKTLILKPAVLI